MDLAPTFLDMGGVPPPSHMDGRSILPLLLSRNRAVRDNWADSFLIESSGRRETAEQIAESRARLLAERRQMKLVNSTLLDDLLGMDSSSTTTTSFRGSSSTMATMLSSMGSTTTEQEQELDEEDVDTDNEDEDGDDAAMDSSAAALDDEELEDVADEEADDDDDELEEQEQQHDNNLPLSPYITKMMRLNSECSDPALLKNCLPGQKWKCVNEEGRWRKHKCKFHVGDQPDTINEAFIQLCLSLSPLQLQLEQQLATMPRKQYQRNCACFTSTGLVYTKIRTPTSSLHGHRLHKRTHHSLGKRRHKREAQEEEQEEIYHTELPYEIEELLDLHQSIDLLSQHGHRNKRSTNTSSSGSSSASNDAIAGVIQQIQSTLETLEHKFHAQELSIRNSNGRGSKFQKGGTRCFVEESTDRVNCSDVIYDDEKTWRKSRNQIDMLIKLLKDKISTLKDMKKQMRESKQQGRRRNGDPSGYHEGAGPEFNMSYFTEIGSTPRSPVAVQNPWTSDGQKEIPRTIYDSLEHTHTPRADCYCEPDVGER